MTATPPVLLTQSVNVVFEYSMRKAIDDGFICDYEVRLPVDEEILIPACLNANDMTSCALFLISGMLETGASKCIIYCSSIDECTSMTKTITDICKTYHGLEYQRPRLRLKREVHNGMPSWKSLALHSQELQSLHQCVSSTRLSTYHDAIQCASHAQHAPKQRLSSACAVRIGRIQAIRTRWRKCSSSLPSMIVRVCLLLSNTAIPVSKRGSAWFPRITIRRTLAK